MSDPITTASVVLSGSEVIKIQPVYEDALQPSIREAGNQLKITVSTLGDFLNALLVPLRLLSGTINITEAAFYPILKRKIERIASEKLQPPPAYIALPAIQAMIVSQYETPLVEMYATLLASSMDTSTANFVHPAFPTVISQMTSDEARLIKFFAHDMPTWNHHKPGYLISDTGVLGKNHNHLIKQARCERPDMVEASLENLVRLQLITMTTEPILVKMTSFGKQFIKACVRD